jgi:hypothetical protein
MKAEEWCHHGQSYGVGSSERSSGESAAYIDTDPLGMPRLVTVRIKVTPYCVSEY